MDKRHHSRVSVGHQCKARFQLGNNTYENITVSNLGSDGCCMQIPDQSIEGLSENSTLEALELIQPGLPKGSLRGKIAWVHGEDKTRPGFLETGVQFMDASVEYIKNLSYYVNTMAHPKFSDPDLMSPDSDL